VIAAMMIIIEPRGVSVCRPNKGRFPVAPKLPSEGGSERRVTSQFQCGNLWPGVAELLR
jgi:hypothetical protein